MNARKVEAARIDYPKHWFVIGTGLYVVLTAVLVYLGHSSKEDFGRTVWFTLAGLEGVLLFLFLVPSLITHHLAGEKALRLKMGVLLNATVPYIWIKDVKEASIHRGGIRVGIGVRYSPIPKILFVTSSFGNLVRLKLDKEHLMGRLLKRPVEEIVVNVVNANAFIDEMRKKAGLEKVA